MKRSDGRDEKSAASEQADGGATALAPARYVSHTHARQREMPGDGGKFHPPNESRGKKEPGDQDERAGGEKGVGARFLSREEAPAGGRQSESERCEPGN